MGKQGGLCNVSLFPVHEGARPECGRAFGPGRWRGRRDGECNHVDDELWRDVWWHDSKVDLGSRGRASRVAESLGCGRRTRSARADRLLFSRHTLLPLPRLARWTTSPPLDRIGTSRSARWTMRSLLSTTRPSTRSERRFHPQNARNQRRTSSFLLLEELPETKNVPQLVAANGRQSPRPRSCRCSPSPAHSLGQRPPFRQPTIPPPSLPSSPESPPSASPPTLLNRPPSPRPRARFTAGPTSDPTASASNASLVTRGYSSLRLSARTEGGLDPWGRSSRQSTCGCSRRAGTTTRARGG